MRRLNWFSTTFEKENGYGYWNLQFVRALLNAGIDVHPHLVDILDAPGWLAHAAGLNFGWLNLSCLPAHEIRNVPGRQWSFSMVEASRAPYEFVERLNSACERLIVPCQQNVDAFKASGVRIPIHIVPGGIDPAAFPLLPDVRRARPYTFLCLGDRGERKGMQEVLTAFYELFPEQQYPDVRLIVKARPHMMPAFTNGSHDDRRVTFWLEDVDSMTHVYEAADCFVYPGYADGWGLPPREAAAMGLPVIAPRHSGTQEDLDCWAIPLERFTEQPARTLDVLTLPPDAVWWVPDWKEVGEKILWCYEHQELARLKGRMAAQWLRENQTWAHAAKTLVELIERWA